MDDKKLYTGIIGGLLVVGFLVNPVVTLLAAAGTAALMCANKDKDNMPRNP